MRHIAQLVVDHCAVDEHVISLLNDRTIGIPNQPNTPIFNRPGPMLPGWDWVNIMPEITRRAVKYIEEKAPASQTKPFFLYFPLTAPHYPVVPAPEFKGKSQAGDF